ncbi:MAG: DUF1289 domain-containing protein [Rhodospirillales bacterium]
MSVDQDHVPSPCIRVCWVDPRTGLCAGCLRTLDEIARWGGMSPHARRSLLAELPGRSSRPVG